MKKIFRYFVVLLITAVVVVTSEINMAWAGLTPKATEDVPLLHPTHRPRPTPRRHPHGTIPRWPGPTITIPGIFSVSGFCTINVEYLAEGYWIQGEVFEDYFMLDPLPAGAGNYLSGFCYLENFNIDELIMEVTSDKVKDKICFAKYPRRQGKIYVFDLPSALPSWTPLETTIEDLFACAPALKSGVYVFVGR